MPPSDCQKLARRIADSLRLAADMIEDPNDMDEEIEQAEQLPSEEPLNLPAAAELEPSDAPVEPVEAPAQRRSPRPIAVVSESKFKAITGLTGDEFEAVAALPPDEFEAAVKMGLRAYLDTQAKAAEAASQPASELLQAAE